MLKLEEKLKKIIDISVPLHTGMVFFPGDTRPEITPARQISDGAVANLSDIHIGSHTGTHVDAPSHFIDGDNTVDELPINSLIGPAQVLDLTGTGGPVSASDLQAAGLRHSERVLLKTRNSGLWTIPEFQEDFISLADDGADLLVEQGVRLIGTDYLSIERFHSETHYVHRRLLEAGVVVLEGADLSEVEAGDYELYCLPLKIRGSDGAPARAVLIKTE
jgi:arylformamidase